MRSVSGTRNRDMKIRFIAILLLFLAALRADGRMLRVLGIESGRTIVVEQNGKPATIALAGVVITDEAAAKTLLEWTLRQSWVLLEERGDGALVYRSPDALFVNRELVLRGFAHATLPGIEPQSHVPVTYLGTIDPMARTPKVRSSPASGNGSGKTRRPPAAPSRRRRTRR